MQSLLDIGMQEAGTSEAAFELAIANDLEVSEDLYNQQALNATAVVDKNIVAFYKKEDRKPATADMIVPEDEREEGVDFWAIEEDFEVS